MKLKESAASAKPESVSSTLTCDSLNVANVEWAQKIVQWEFHDDL